MELGFYLTPYDTINVIMEIDKKIKLKNVKEFQLFQSISILGKYSKVYIQEEKAIYNWELHISLADFIKYRFSKFSKCKINF